MLSGEKFSRAEEIFQAVVTLPVPDRASALAAQCAGDEELRAFVEGLLRSDADGTKSFLETPALRVESSTAAQADELPRRIGRYEIIQKIGEGGMGVVYEARQENPGRTVALKVIAPGLGSRQVLRRFQLEAEILGHLQHPGIAHVYEAGVSEVQTASGFTVTQPYLAMELIHGRPLLEHVNACHLGTRERIEMLARIADAVHHAHQRGVIHRDLKPANILVGAAETPVSKSGETSAGTRNEAIGQPKILDFGVARATDSDIHAVTLQTDVGQLIGTVPYMSPEQVAGDPSQLDMRSDVYALGVILYELLAGKLPLEVRNRAIPDAVRIIREEEPSRLSSINTTFRGDIETIVQRAMEKDRDRRYQSAAELAGDLRRFLRDEPIIARRASAAYQFQKFAKRNKAMVASSAATLLALVLGVIGMAWFAVRESSQRRLAEARLIEAQEARDAENLERQRAERRFQEVQSLARTVLFDLYDEVQALPGATKAREQIVRTGIEYLDKLASEAGDDVGLLKGLAEGYSRLASVQGMASLSNLGDTKGSLESQEKSLRIVEKLCALRPDDPESMSALGAAHELVSIALRRVGRSQDALDHTKKHLEIAKKLVAQDPASAKYKRGLAGAYVNLGRLQASMGQLDEAIENHAKYLEYTQNLLAQKPSDIGILTNLAMINGSMGELRLVMKQYDQASAHFKEGERIARQIIAADPENVRIVNSLSNLLRSQGIIQIKLGKPDDALPYYEEVLSLRSAQAEIDPADFHAKRNLAVAEFMIGDVFQEKKEYNKALAHFLKYRDLIEKVADADPNYVVVQRDLALAHQRLCAIYKAQGNADEAMESAKSALELIQGLQEKEQQDVQFTLDLSTCHYDVGDVRALMGEAPGLSAESRLAHWQAARLDFEKSKRILDELKSSGRLPPASEAAISRTDEALRDCDERIKQLSDDGEPSRAERANSGE